MKILNIVLMAVVLVISSSANAALVGRLADSNGVYQAYYDDVANLTWLADSNAGIGSGYDSYGDGRMGWDNANAWVAQLSVGGVSGWRLTDTLELDTSCDRQSGSVSYGANCTGSEMGNLFYNVLGNSAGSLSNTGPFSIQPDIRTNFYWSGTEYTSDTVYAWVFNMGGSQGYYNKSTNYMYVWAVQSGDVSPVPVPAAAWLFGSGLLGLAGFARRKKA